MVEPIIEVKNLSVIYNQGKANEVRSLVDANVKIYPQEYVLIYGPSGCGKSTLLYSISGLQMPTAGEVKIRGKDIASMNKKEMVHLHRFGIGMIFQAFYLIPTIHVLFNVCLPKIFEGISKKDRQEAGMKLLQRFGIAEQARKFPSQLSGGQKQRAAIARSLINNPDIILADEPVGNLDSESAENVMKILKDLNDVDKKTIILVTHNADHLHYADRILHMKDGKILSEEINRDKRPKEALKEEVVKVPDVITNELRLLMRTFRNFSPQQVGGLLVPYKAKQLLSHILSELTDEQMRAAENFLNDLLFKNIDMNMFEHNLDVDLDNGGGGWNKIKAKYFSLRVNQIMNQAALIERGGENMIENFAEYLIAVFKLNLNDELRERLASFLKLRLDNRIDCFGLQERLDAPTAVGGVGLYSVTAEKMVREVEMIMLLKYSG